MTATTGRTEAATSADSGLRRRAVAALGEQGAISLFQFSPVLAATISDRPNALAWTAAFTACFGLIVATYRGAIIHPIVRADGNQRRYPAGAFAVVSAALAAGLLTLGLVGVFSTEGTLFVLAVTAPTIGFVEMGRVAPGDGRDRTITIATAATLAAVVTLFPLYSQTEATPVRIAVVWSAGWVLLMVRFALRPDRVTLSTGVGLNRNAATGLTINNLIGQAAAQGPLLVLAAVLGPGPLSVLQAARVPFRPIAIVAGALPVHYLPYLVESRNRPGRWSRSVGVLLIVGLAGTAASLAPAVLLLPSVAVFAQTAIAVTVVAAVVAAVGIAEAALGVVAVASGDERGAITARLVGLGIALAAIAVLALIGRLDPLTAVVTLGITPAVTAVLLRRIVPWV